MISDIKKDVGMGLVLMRDELHFSVVSFMVEDILSLANTKDTGSVIRCVVGMN